MSMLLKTEAEVLDYGVDWSGWLETGDQIQTSSWAVEAGLTVGGQQHDDASATIWLSGGAAGTRYWVTNRITTTAGRTAERAFRLRVVERRIQ